MTTILSFKQAAQRATRVALTLVTGAALLCSCTQEDAPDAPDGGDRIPVTFTAEINSSVASGATSPKTGEELRYTRTTGGGDTWKSTDRIGIIMARAGTDIYTSGGNGILYDNIEYAVGNIGTDGVWSTATLTPVSGNPTYYPRTGKVDFYAYYPHTAKGNNSGELDEYYNYTIDLKDQSNPAAIDVLYAEAKNVARSRTPIELSFSHVFAKVTFNVKAGDGIAAADIAAMKSDDVKVKFNFSDLVEVKLYLQGNTTPSKSATSPQVSAYKESTASDGADATFSVIVCPAVDAKTPVRFTVGGKTYTVTLDPTVPDGHWYPGYNYVYPVTVKRTGIEVVDEPEIRDWEVEDKGTGTVLSDMVYIRPGTFLMGSSDGSNIGNKDGSGLNTTPAETGRFPQFERQHRVTLTKGFWISKYAVTNAQYADFMNAVGFVPESTGGLVLSVSAELYPDALFPYGTFTNLWLFEDSSVRGGDGTPGLKYENNVWKTATPGYENHPVTHVSWYGAMEYAHWVGATLPTEAQWEYACRAGTTTTYFFGDDATNIDKYVHCNTQEGAANYTTVAVDDLLPNPWGLYNMLGNTSEWCLDAMDPAEDWNYPVGPAIDPVRPGPTEYYMRRGGWWGGKPENVRSASRNWGVVYTTYDAAGFRLVINE